MGSCILIGAGDFGGLLEPIQRDDYVIAVDGGLNHAKRLGIIPNTILGDFDSLGLVPDGSTAFPIEKDDTDMMLAVKHGLRECHERFVIYGGMDGRRLDHTIANFQTLGFLVSHGAHGFLIGRDYIATALDYGTLIFPPTMQGDFSCFSLGASVRSVTIENLYYKADQVTLNPDFPLGVSNHFIGKEARVTVRGGTLLAMWQTQTPLPGIEKLEQNQ